MIIAWVNISEDTSELGKTFLRLVAVSFDSSIFWLDIGVAECKPLVERGVCKVERFEVLLSVGR